MEKIKFSCFAWLLALLAMSLPGVGQYKNTPTLKIGDPAPQIKVEGWARGEAITSFEKGKVYVLDFWATWCGGCIASFPHISFVANKYRGKVRFCSVDSYEVDELKKGKIGRAHV